MTAAERSPRLPRIAALALCALGLASVSWAQNGNVAVNTTGAAAAPLALLDVSSVSQGLLIPRMATLPGPAGLPPGLTVFRIGTASTRGFYVLEYGQWMPLLSSSKNAWDVYGNHLGNAANPNPDYLGTTDNKPMYFRTNNVHRMRLDATTGNLGVGFVVGAPAAPERLDINGALRMYYVPSPGQQTSSTDAEGVMRYQTYGAVTTVSGITYGSREVLAAAAVVAPQPAYPLIQAGHWGNVDGTGYNIGATIPTVTQPDVKGWRLFENVYEEGFNRTYNHFKEAVCVAGTADIPSGVTYVNSNAAALTADDQERVTPFLTYYGIGLTYLRRQYLFLSHEVNMELAQGDGVPAVEGLCAGQPVNQIGFWVSQNPAVTRGVTNSPSNFSVTVRNGTVGLNALNGFDNAAYSGTLSCGTPVTPWPSLTAPHWEMITLSPPFVWDGSSNVIIEVAIKENPGGVGTNNAIRVTNAGFNATYAANATYGTFPQMPIQTSNAPSCSHAVNAQTRMVDADGNPSYHSGPTMWRPVVRFSGTVAHVNATAPITGTSNFLTYPGAFIIEDTLGSTVNRPWGLWRPGYPTGNSFWANQGKGTISAQRGVFDNGSRLNDFVFDRTFDGRVAPGDAAQFGDRHLLTMDEMAAFTKEHRHLPTMKGRNAWEREGGFSLGDLTNQIWATTETQTLYVTELHDKLNVIEMLTNERPITPAELQVAVKELSAMADLSDGDKARLIADLRKRATLTSTSR